MISEKEILRLRKEYWRAGKALVEAQEEALLQRWGKHKAALVIEAKNVFGPKTTLNAEISHDPECANASLWIHVICTKYPDFDDMWSNALQDAVENVFDCFGLSATLFFKERESG